MRSPSPVAALLPLYDEYLIAYKDRSAALNPARWNPFVARDSFMAPIVVEGKVTGGWKRAVKNNRVEISLRSFVRLAGAAQRAVRASAQAYAEFFGLDSAITNLPSP